MAWGGLKKQYFSYKGPERFGFCQKVCYLNGMGAVSSAVEHLVYTERVGSSKLSPPTIL